MHSSQYSWHKRLFVHIEHQQPSGYRAAVVKNDRIMIEYVSIGGSPRKQAALEAVLDRLPF